MRDESKIEEVEAQPILGELVLPQVVYVARVPFDESDPNDLYLSAEKRALDHAVVGREVRVGKYQLVDEAAVKCENVTTTVFTSTGIAREDF